MPLVGLIGDDGNRYSRDEALAACEAGSDAFPLPYPLLKGMLDAQQDRGDDISATSLLHCLRNEYLTRREDYYVRPVSLYPAFRGTLFHSLMEKNAPTNARVEERHYRSAFGHKISGQFDSLVVYETPNESGDGKKYVLQDWKTSGKLPQYGSPWSSHIEQVNIYRWLLKLPVEETRVEVWYFSMEGFVRTVLKDGTGKSKVNQMWSDEKVEAFLKDKLLTLKASLLANTPMPYYLVPEDAKWQCDYCPLLQRCHDLAEEENEARWRRNAGLPPAGTPVDIAAEWQTLISALELPDDDRPDPTPTPRGRGKGAASRVQR